MRKPSKTTEKRTVTLRTEIVEQLSLQAEEENRSFSNMVETAALSYLKGNEHVQM